MHQITEDEAENLSAVQATELVRVLDLQAGWENHRADPTKNVASIADLNARQKAFDAFQTVSTRYAGKYGNAQPPEPTRSMPDRLAIWCRVLRILCRRAEGVCPVQMMEKVYRLTDRSATRMGKERVGRGIREDMAGVLRELDVVIAWCVSMGPPPYLSKNQTGNAA